jgi:hypothetical protein
VSLLAINTSQRRSHALMLPDPAERYTLHAARVQGTIVQLNGKTLALTSDGRLPPLPARAAASGAIRLAPTTITFLVLPNAANPACLSRRSGS